MAAGMAIGGLGSLVWNKRNGYFAQDTWSGSRALRVAASVLFMIPGLEPERLAAVHPEKLRRPERAATAARRARIGTTVACLLAGAALIVVGLVA